MVQVPVVGSGLKEVVGFQLTISLCCGRLHVFLFRLYPLFAKICTGSLDLRKKQSLIITVISCDGCKVDYQAIGPILQLFVAAVIK